MGRRSAEGQAGADRPQAAVGAHGAAEDRVQAIAALRRADDRRGDRDGVGDAALDGARRCWRGSALGKLSRRRAGRPANRYERARPGELIRRRRQEAGRDRGAGHRGDGERQSRSPTGVPAAAVRPRAGSCVHVCVDAPHAWPRRRVLARRAGPATAAGFASRGRVLPPLRDHRRPVIERQRRRDRSAIHAFACRLLGLNRDLRTGPLPARTNGKAERFIRTLHVRSLTPAAAAAAVSDHPLSTTRQHHRRPPFGPSGASA